MAHKPIPCPFCGCEWTKIVDVAGTPFHCVECEACGAQGPGRLGMADAIIAWNARHYSPAQAAAPELLEELENCVQDFNNLAMQFKYGSDWREIAGNCASRIAELVKKARGE